MSPETQVQRLATASSLPCSLYFHWPSMQAFLDATAEIKAAPRPLPSSDSMKVISQLGVSLRTLVWNRSLKLGCSLYTEPSTPTVMRITSSLRLSRMRLMTPASPAAHMCAARVDTLSQARRTMSQSVAEGLSPSVLRML